MSLFRRAFEGNKSELVKKIDINHGLLSQLLDWKVLTDEQIASCEARVCQMLPIPIFIILVFFMAVLLVCDGACHLGVFGLSLIFWPTLDSLWTFLFYYACSRTAGWLCVVSLGNTL